jgi:CheY-like chemotaxis protein/anti-sigma regulatory factor (Ser/Thr protein kinase)
MLDVRARDSGVQFEIVEREAEEKLLLGDSQRITQIVTNFISNAIKFSEGGRVVVTKSHAGEQLLIGVSDNGIGMSSEVVEKLFQRYEQGSSEITSRYGGTGLGLYISKKLARLMSGEITVESEPGKGATFTLSLPYRVSSIPARKEEHSASSGWAHGDLFTGHILVAEDTELLQELEQRILEKMGVTVSVANNGVEAIKCVQQKNYDLILMDMQMPEMDGLEATRTLREQGCSLPIIALTANVMQKHRDAAIQAGCDGFLSKPINKPELRKILKQYLVPSTPSTVLN